MEKNEKGYSKLEGLEARDTRLSEAFPAETVQLAMVYSPINRFRALYSPEDALTHGTLFEELYKPLGKGGRCGG